MISRNKPKNICRRPRLLFVVPKYPYPVVGGLEKQSHELAKSLVNKDFDVKILSSRFDKNHVPMELNEGVLVKRIPWIKSRILRFILTPFFLFKEFFIARDSFDIVHLHQYSWYSVFIIILSRLLKKQIITKIPNDGKYGLVATSKNSMGRLRTKIVKLSDALISMTKETSDEIVEIGYSLNRVLFAPNGITLGEKDLRLEERNESGEITRVVFVGGLREQKGVMDLLYAWEMVTKSTTKTVELEIWGEGPLESELKSLSHRLSIEDTVVFRGYVEAVREKLCQMDIFVLPSLGEGNSNSILEAMASGLPIVSTVFGGTLMQVGEMGRSFLVKTGDRMNLSRQILSLIEDNELRKSVGRSMRRRVSECFEINKVSDSYANAYDCLFCGNRTMIGSISNPSLFDHRVIHT